MAGHIVAGTPLVRLYWGRQIGTRRGLVIEIIELGMARGELR